jgi:hypothetical protein
MGRGIIGKSKGDVAMDKMIKFMEKSDRQAQKQGPSNKPKEDPIISQLKQLYPDSWQDELDEMRLEAKNPAYLQAKKEFKLVAAKAYYNQSRMARDEAGLTENQYVLRQLRLWKAENRARFTKK